MSTRLHYFQTVAGEGSIRRAAALLNIAPSAISRTIGLLEAELGVQLFDRIGRRLKLTSAGETLLHHSRASVQELSHALSFIDDLQGLRRGNVRIAVIESMMRYSVITVLDQFWKRFPNVSVEATVLGSQAAFDSVAEGKYDLAVAFDTPVPRKARRLASARLHLGALLPPDHPLATRKSLRFSDLRDQRILLADKGLTLAQTLSDAASAAGLVMEARATTNSIDALIRFAVSGHGVSFQTRLGAEPELHDGKLVFVPLVDRHVTPRKLLLICRSNGVLAEGPAALASVLSRAINQLDESLPVHVTATTGSPNSDY